MSFGSTSSVFAQFLLDPILKAGSQSAVGFSSLTATDVIKVALFNNSVTPDRTAAVASTGYNTGTWTTANEITDATNWVAGGRTLSGAALAASGAVCSYTASNTASGGACTFANPAYGVLVYDSSITSGTVAKQGICFNAFGGPAQVTNGSFTVVWNASGLFQITAS